MHRLLLPSLLVACASTTPVEVPDDSADTLASDDTGTPSGDDTTPVWPTGLDTGRPDGGGGGVDPNIGEIQWAGSWSGTFLFEDNQPLVVARNDPACEGTVTVTISGTNPQPRHVVGRLSSETWDPNLDLIPGNLDPPYGALEGDLLGTFADGRATQASVNLAIGDGGAFGDWQVSGVTMTFEGDTARLVKREGTFGGRLSAGRRITIDLTRD